jgi:hypothetical protein
MGTTGAVSIDLELVFPTAGVRFAVHIRPGEAGQGASLGVELQSVDESQQARFTPQSSYALADFVGGFCRWLGTKGIKATYTDAAISGQFQAQYTAMQLLATTQELCQMLDDKFGAYPYSILS